MSADSGQAGDQAADQAETEPARPLLRIVRGDPTAEELAALVTVVAAMSGAATEPERPPAPAWSAPRRAMRGPFPHGRGGWRASALPR